MRIGVQIVEEGASPRRMAEEARGIAARGFAHAWLGQSPGGVDPLSVLAAAGEAGAAGFELGTAVVPTYPRHPVNLAATALTVQSLTGGRPTLGVGPSHRRFVADRLGLDYGSPAVHTREYLEIPRPLLRGESLEYRGST